MSYLVVTTCTDRKRHASVPSLQARSLPRGSLSELSAEWARRTSGASPVGPAHSVYCGRAFREALNGAADLQADLWIISAGLGLISTTREIPSYSLTMSRRSPDSIGDKITDPHWTPSDWRRALIGYQSEPATIPSLLGADPKRTLLVALSEKYAELLRDELDAVSEGDRKRLRLFGLRIESTLSPQLHDCIMPFDRRLDGPDSPIAGTLADFAQRALRHFCTLHLSRRADGASLEKDRRMVCEAIDSWRLPDIPSRLQKSDEEIRGLIRRHWDVVQGRSGRMLRFLRDDLQVACEQGRFRRLFHEVTERVPGTQGELV